MSDIEIVPDLNEEQNESLERIKNQLNDLAQKEEELAGLQKTLEMPNTPAKSREACEKKVDSLVEEIIKAREQADNEFNNAWNATLGKGGASDVSVMLARIAALRQRYASGAYGGSWFKLASDVLKGKSMDEWRAHKLVDNKTWDERYQKYKNYLPVQGVSYLKDKLSEGINKVGNYIGKNQSPQAENPGASDKAVAQEVDKLIQEARDNQLNTGYSSSSPTPSH